MEAANQFSKEFKSALKSLTTKPDKKFWKPGIHSYKSYRYYGGNSDRGAKTLTEQELTVLLEAFRNPTTVANLGADPEVNQDIQTIQSYWLKGMLEELENACTYKVSRRKSTEAQAAQTKARKAKQEATRIKAKEEAEKRRIEQERRDREVKEKLKEQAKKRKEAEKQRDAKRLAAAEKAAMEKLQAKMLLENLKLDPKQKALLKKTMKV